MTAKPSTSAPKRTASPEPLNDWIAQYLAPNAHIQMRLRGNILHVLCETLHPLHQSGAISRLVDALLGDDANVDRITDTYPQVYQLYIYSRQLGRAKPDWTSPIYLNRLEKHQAQLQHQAANALKIADAHGMTGREGDAGSAAPTWPQDDATTALVLSNLSLARQGDSDAIAWYLSEVLSTLDVGVWVSVRASSSRIALQREAVSAEEGRGAEIEASEDEDIDEANRLWVWCEATYSPDPLLIAEPVTERLRQLSLTQFKDAVIVIQVHGEDTPDWSLRIDLTPAEEMLREWARWGDEAAITRLLNWALADFKAEVLTERKEDSLHCIIQAITGPDSTASPAVPLPTPDEEPVMTAIAPLLEGLAPQGIQRAVIYGQATDIETADWVYCLKLPASEHLDLAEDPMVLAQRGDLPALAYLLTRLLNPDLDAQLATGGIRIQVLRRDKLLHVMADAPVCPTRRQVVPQVLDFIDALKLTEIKGMRLYGRRAGQQRPAWSYGKDFQDRPQLVPKAEPIFAVSDSYVGDLVSHSGTEAPTEDNPETAAGLFQQAWHLSLEQVRRLLTRTQLVVPQRELSRNLQSAPTNNERDAFKIGLVWGAVGLLLALQVDWIFGQIVSPETQRNAVVDAATAAETDETTLTRPDQEPLDGDRATDDLIQDDLIQDDWDADDEEDFFTNDGFTPDAAPAGRDPFETDLIASPNQSLAPTPELLAYSPYPSFRSQQMDEKLALYHQRLAESGPPDVLIIGSSRALRGVDPAALRRELAALGYGDLSIFNFGINGATAQVVDLTIRRALEPHQLPRLIIWADGARAFNSGRTDVTYNAIATSAGYQELGRRNPETATDTDAADGGENDAEATLTPIGENLRQSYQALDETLSNQLGRRSAVYAERDQLKALVRDYLLTPLVDPISLSLEEKEAVQNTSDMPIPEGSRIDFDGFLALDVRFNPATYYQLYARVPGAYDSDYEDFGLEGEQTRAFNQLLDYTQEQGIPLIFVNTPLTDEYLDGYRSNAEEEFQKAMLEYSATEDDFIFRDLGQTWTNRYDYFSDPSHLNRYGAYQVSLQLAQDPMIPWPRALDLSAAESGSTP
ncbi:DUF1574 domain-containing protein [Oscillatoria sp. CS-180]|uniref:DUF1574 domain-containing protein n=1 Tax=Oscillatoria sp. CS-180 TaxID=3021720 RepID=UPI00232BE7F3|nr:DUF1574 domain-containing protein [Oscillatoria sp. CS-180]MDB9529470.1 DUF1574 domain-containing protein [Oscillatoria sp. CS-180]